jgi:DNA transformation protein
MSRDYCDYVVDLLSSWAKVSAKAMFGGYGMYRQGQIFAIVVDDTLYFKVGEAARRKYPQSLISSSFRRTSYVR